METVNEKFGGKNYTTTKISDMEVFDKNFMWLYKANYKNTYQFVLKFNNPVLLMTSGGQKKFEVELLLLPRPRLCCCYRLLPLPVHGKTHSFGPGFPQYFEIGERNTNPISLSGP